MQQGLEQGMCLGRVEGAEIRTHTCLPPCIDAQRWLPQAYG